MATIGNNLRTLLHGLSDFWVKFYADSDELTAIYQGSEVLLAQGYLDMLSSFLNISIVETPLFNTEFFKLVTLREDHLIYDEAFNPLDDRLVASLPDTLIEAHILQNKVIDPTASIEEQSGYEIDSTNYQFRFTEDPAGRTMRTLGQSNTGSLLTYGIGALTRLYVDVDGTQPFAKAKYGQWLQLLNSGSGNNKVFLVAEKVDDYTLLLQGTFTLPDLNNGALQATLIDAEFVAREGFAQRSLVVESGGRFDDPTRRRTLEEGGTLQRGSWYANAPLGLGVRKGDIIRVFDNAALASVPQDFIVGVVRHDRLYLSTDTPAPAGVHTIADYVVLRESPDSEVIEEPTLFVPVNTDKTGTAGSTLWNVGENAATFNISLAAPPADQFAGSDKQRYVTLGNCGAIAWTANIALDGTLTWTGGPSQNPLVRGMVGAQIKVTGSSLGQNNVYTIAEYDDPTGKVCKLSGVFMVETGLTCALSWIEGATLVGITNAGTYRVKKVLGAFEALFDLPVVYPDPNNTAITHSVHDGYIGDLDHFYVVDGSVEVFAGVGDQYTGGLHDVVDGVDYRLDSRAGTLIQIGRFAGTWGLVTPVNVNYAWLRIILATGTTGELNGDDLEMSVNEVALWAPDAKVDKYHLYENYGYLINRFQPSSETYREFIRGVFQLYMLGPTLQHVESALNVIGSLPVIRDDGELLRAYDTSAADQDVIRTLRPDGSTAEYVYPKDTPMREDIVAWTTGDPDIAFLSFEPLTLMFVVTDYVQDPTWWESIIIPQELLPGESVLRRTSVPALYENTLGALDGPELGDPGFFIGADDEGNVPANPALPAKRRRFANVLLNTFFKYHVCYVHVDPIAFKKFSGSFIRDLQELVLIAKPSYKYVYIEPTSSFLDVMRLLESDVQIDVKLTVDEEEVLVGEQTLTIQSLSWNLGDVWRFNVPVASEALTATTPPGYTQLTNYPLISWKITGPASLIEWVDFYVDQKAGRIYPLTTWPSGSYTVAYSSIKTTAAASANPALGDTPYVLGCNDPGLTRVRREAWRGATVVNAGSYVYFEDLRAQFESGLHDHQYITIHESSTDYAGLVRIASVLSPTRVVLQEAIASATDILWSFPSEEPRDGFVTFDGHFKSSTALFRPWRTSDADATRGSPYDGMYLRIMDSIAGNDGVRRVATALSMAEAILAGPALNPETNIHWRLEGDPKRMDLIERPLQIKVVPVP